MDSRGLGYERVGALLAAGFIADVADPYARDKVNAKKLLGLEGFAEKSAQHLIDAIDASKTRPLSTLLFALGIRHVGAQGAKLLARQFGTMAALAKADPEEIAEIRGVGPAIADAVAGFFAEPPNPKLAQAPGKLGGNLPGPPSTEGTRPLSGPTFLVTGTPPPLVAWPAARV